MLINKWSKHIRLQGKGSMSYRVIELLENSQEGILRWEMAKVLGTTTHLLGSTTQNLLARGVIRMEHGKFFIAEVGK